VHRGREDTISAVHEHIEAGRRMEHLEPRRLGTACGASRISGCHSALDQAGAPPLPSTTKSSVRRTCSDLAD